jgi:hypothetical protein
MFLAVCLPTIAAFIAFWKCINKEDAREWVVGFFAYFASVFALSMGLMLGTQQNRFDPYGLQATLMIFAVCVPIALCFALHYVHWSLRSFNNIYQPYPFQWKLGFALSFAFIFALALVLIIALPTRPRDVSFSIPASQLKAGKTAVLATLGFTPSIFGGIRPGGTITLTYPDSFFAPSVTPVVPVGGSNVAGLTATCGATTATSLVITTAGAAMPPSALIITMTGFTMGGVTAGSVGVIVQTSADLLPSAAVHSGWLGHAIWDVYFIISDVDRKAGKTLGFSGANSVPAGGTITLTYPSGFFAPSITPTVAAGGSSVAGLTGTCGATTATSVVITTAGAAIPAAAFVVTISGFSNSNIARQPAWSPDGSKIATASDDRTARVCSSSSGSTLLTYTGYISIDYGSLNSVAWSPDGSKIVTASVDGTARVWSSSSGSTLVTLTGRKFYFGPVAWSPDGSKIAAASDIGTARVWSSSSGSTLLTYTEHSEGVVKSIAWSPDRSKIATASRGPSDRTARVWSSSSGSTLLTLTGHSNDVSSVAWSPDGSMIATASYDGTARVWYVG